MVPSRFVLRSLASGEELGDSKNMAFHIGGTNPASLLFSSRGGGVSGEGCGWREVALLLGVGFPLVSQDVASHLSKPSN